ncbi:hypothetical protein VRB52_09385 [Pseudomonas trivialis]|uniref:hypothetical protein n=1 Tax=Pseudomonas trivialis TaxID=200450 RepID=UPI0030D236CC
MTDNPTAPRIAPMTYNARGNPVHTWTLTPSHITDPVHCILPPDGVLPVIFVPGIMGSNLKSKPAEQESEDQGRRGFPSGGWMLDFWVKICGWRKTGYLKQRASVKKFCTRYAPLSITKVRYPDTL